MESSYIINSEATFAVFFSLVVLRQRKAFFILPNWQDDLTEDA